MTYRVSSLLPLIKYDEFIANSYSRIIKLLLLSFVLMTSIQMTGCSINVNIKAGKKPDIDALEKTLTIGKSTEQDVLAALGDPIGKGGVIFPFMDMPKNSWTYYYEEGDLKDDRRLFLFILFANQRYDGYMWFSSLPEFKPKISN
jgi:hypothetical protein